MKRHAALRDLARDHFHALVCAQALRKAVTAEETEEAARALVHLWNEDLIYHFREEEEVLLPILSRYGPPSEDPDVRRMLDDHALLRDGLRSLEMLLTSGGDYESLAIDLGQALEAHARLEDRMIFGRMEECLSEADLEEVAKLSREYRERWHRPTGPVKGACSTD